jgi:hypothetical protein
MTSGAHCQHHSSAKSDIPNQHQTGIGTFFSGYKRWATNVFTIEALFGRAPLWLQHRLLRSSCTKQFSRRSRFLVEKEESEPFWLPPKWLWFLLRSPPKHTKLTEVFKLWEEFGAGWMRPGLKVDLILLFMMFTKQMKLVTLDGSNGSIEK